MKKSQLKYGLVVLVVALVFSTCFAIPPTSLPPHTYQILKCDFHTHTTVSDGEYTPAKLVNIYKGAGYDVIAVTDHDTTLGYEEAYAEGIRLNLTVIRGEEVTHSWPDGTQKHIVALFTSQKIGSWGDDLDVPTIFDRIHAQNGLGIVAHAEWSSWVNWQNYQIASYIDGWEVYCSMQWIYKTDYIYLLNHDFHKESDIDGLSKRWTYILANNRTEDGVREALASRRTVIYENGILCGSPYSLSLFARARTHAASLAFDSKPGDPHWNQAADLNNDDVVDIFDIVLLANNFGKTA